MRNFRGKLQANSLHLRIFLVAFLAIIPILGIMIFAFRENQQLARDAVYREDLAVAHAVSADQAGVISQTKGLLSALAQVPQVRAEDGAASDRLFVRLLKNYPYYDNIGIADADGDVVASALPYAPVNIAERTFFQQALHTRDLAVGDYQTGYITGRPDIDVAYPVLDGSGQPKAVLVAALNLEWLGTLLQETRLPPGSTIDLVDRNGIILSRVPDGRNWVGRPISPMFGPLLKADADKEGTTQGRGVDGVDRLYAFTPLEGTAMVVVVGIQEEIAFAGWKKAVIYDIYYLIAVFVLFAVLIWKGSELVLFQPLSALTGAARRLAGGDMSARSDLVYAGETGELARAFDVMAASLETEQKKLYTIIDELPGYTWVQDLDYSIIFANKSLIRNLGNPMNKRCYEFFHNRSETCENCPLVDTLQAHKPSTFQFNIANGKVLEVHQRFFIDIDGRPLILRMGIDITKKRAVEDEIIRLDRLNLVGEMAATIAHEIRNPMTTVRGFLQMLGAKEECRKYSDYYNLMIDELDSANSIIMEYLSLTRRTQALQESCNLNDLIRQVHPLITSDAAGLCLNIETDLQEIPSLSLNKKEIGQLLLNLVRNGLEAMNGGGTLTIRTFAEGDIVVLAVRDQGGGIDPAILNKLGTPFVTTKEKGTGLGLSVCYAIADRNGAGISVDTGPGGTVFYVRFRVEAA